MDKLKISTKITTIEEAAKALQSVEKSFNKLLEKVNSPAEKELKETEGETGDIQVAQNLDKSYTFLVKTEDGWKTPVIGDSAIKFKDKPSTLSAEKKESIDEIESKDSSTGDTKAKKTIYDEKSDKFVLPRPDYDSGWQTFTRASHDGSGDTPLKVEHGLGVLPSMMIGYYAPDQSPSNVTWFTAIKNDRGYSYDNGIGMYVDNVRVYFWAGTHNSIIGVPAPSDTSNCDEVTFDDGSVKVLLWK